MCVIEFFVVFHRNTRAQSFFEPGVEINQMRINIVNESVFWEEAQCYGKATTKWLYKSAVVVLVPVRTYKGKLPSLAASPF
tara:strand:- start:489 stop:731 length:243 start_codon:yes stop_codon:yes gene_type:complete